MSHFRRSRILLPVWFAWLINQPFRALRCAHLGFGPGAKNAITYYRKALWAALFDRDRLKWHTLRVTQWLRRTPR